MKTCPLCEKSWPSQHTTCPTDGALLIDTRELEPGTLIRGKYRIERQLGRGGMGTVYLAEHILLNRQRALKFISSELSQDATFLRRFRREAQAATELLHPNVVQVVDLDQAEDGSPYIAMEFVDGPDLRHALAAAPFSIERTLSIVRGIAQGLGAAHAKGIVHRDVKPENILLAGGHGSPETPKLLDFGIAAMKETATAVSRTHGLMLTPPYAAPEQWKGMAAEELDGRTDLYALGGVLYEMLTGQTPFHAHNTEGWMYQHLHEQPQPPSALRPELANWPGLDALVLRLLAKDRNQRFPSAADLLEALALAPSKASEACATTVTQPTPAPHIPTVVEPPPPPIPPPAPKPVVPKSSPAPKPVVSEPSPAPVPSWTFPLKWRVVTALLILAVAGIWFETRPSTWTDPATGLTWAKSDNGNDVNWQQATDYCRNLQLVNHSDYGWRLPTIEELKGIYGSNPSGNLQLSGWWYWSSTQEYASGWKSVFSFLNRIEVSYRIEDSKGGRALCVRGSSSKVPASAMHSSQVTPQTAPTSDNQKPKANPNDIWTDPATGLMWTKRDSAAGYRYDHGIMSDQGMAAAYCRNLKLDGFSDWTLPSIDELVGLYDTTQTRNTVDANTLPYHMKLGITLNGIAAWSKTSSDGDKGFNFDNGQKSADPYGDSEGDSIALCVRGSASKGPAPAVNPASVVSIHSNPISVNPPQTIPVPVNPQPNNPAPVSPPSNPSSATPQLVANSNFVWTDPATGLMWSKMDNGNDVTWQQATDYCRNLQLAGHSGWRLATIDELQGIYDANARGNNVKGGLQLSSSTWFVWSSSPGNASGRAWGFGFFSGKRSSGRSSNSNGGRALCVRR